jgi:hypothetical protein
MLWSFYGIFSDISLILHYYSVEFNRHFEARQAALATSLKIQIFSVSLLAPFMSVFYIYVSIPDLGTIPVGLYSLGDKIVLCCFSCESVFRHSDLT